MKFWSTIRRWFFPACPEQLHEHIPLTDEQISEMKRLYLGGHFTQRDLAERYSINQSNVSRILAGLRHKQEG